MEFPIRSLEMEGERIFILTCETTEVARIKLREDNYGSGWIWEREVEGCFVVTVRISMRSFTVSLKSHCDIDLLTLRTKVH